MRGPCRDRPDRWVGEGASGSVIKPIHRMSSSSLEAMKAARQAATGREGFKLFIA
jgi:hypothetical protein